MYVGCTLNDVRCRVLVENGPDDRALKNDFVVGNIQDACIIGLDLLERWDAVGVVAARKLCTWFVTVELGGLDWPPV